MILTNATVVTHDDAFLGTVEVESGRIHSISEGRSMLPQAVDLEGDWLIPGLVEIHTDNLEKHLMPRPGVLWNGESAFRIHDAQLACSGITTAFDGVVIGDIEANTPRGRFLEISLAAIHALADSPLTRVEHLLHLRCELANHDVWDHYGVLVDHPRVQLISLMDHTPGQRQWRDMGKYREYTERHGRLSDEAFEALVADRRSAQAEHAERQRQRLVTDARARGLALASHDDTSVEHVCQAHEEGISISEFPTTVEAAQAAQRLGLKTVMGAPNVVKGGSHSGNVAAMTLAQMGLLDALSSDYVPASLLDAAFLLKDETSLTLPEAMR
ncbi:MAG: alpha-D-ribose 1-methylphosphonate 5-triphosphate diphosphatase, partial [Betaproteobacteria bacterium]|nr:alpha-D-ribose 1-methylphosphonate 5-triphosphate diphosphatase [Betaproteobacteria bacterium]